MSRATKVVARERELKAIELRKAGAAYEQIGRTLGITHEGARKAVLRALARIIDLTNETAETYRQLQLVRIDDMRKSVWAQARSGHLAAIDRVLRLDEREARLLGLFAPEQAEVRGDLRVVVEYIDRPMPEYALGPGRSLIAPRSRTVEAAVIEHGELLPPGDDGD